MAQGTALGVPTYEAGGQGAHLHLATPSRASSGSKSRLEATRKAYEAAGARLKEFYLVTGQYDAVAVLEAPDEETVARLALSLDSRGNVRTETMRAFTEAEFRRIIAALP